MKKFFPALLIIMVVLSSGCTVPFLEIEIPFLPDIFPGMQVKEQRHDIISIERLQVIPSPSLRPGQTIRLRAVIKNLQKPEYGPVKDVIVGLYNDCGVFDVDVDFCQGRKSEGRDEDTGMFQCTFEKMYPQSTAVVEWKLRARNVNVETPCKIGVLAKYKFTTYSTTSVTFVNKAQLERMISEGKSFSEVGVATIGEGPVKPYIEVLNQPIIIDEREGGTGLMSFWIENRGFGVLDIAEAGKGNVIFSDSCERGDYKNKLCIHVESEVVSKPLEGTGTVPILKCIQEHMKTKDENGNEVYSATFIGRKTPKYSCSITLPDPSRVKEEKTYQISAEIGYTYKFTKETTITIKPHIRL